MTLKVFLFATAAFIGAMGGYLLNLGIKSRRLGKASEQWPQVPGKITSISIKTITTTDNEGNLNTLYEPRATFDYRVGNHPFSGSKISFRDLQTTANKAEGIAAKYPVGTQVSVAYDPASPTTSVLETGFSGFNWNIFNAVVAIAAALVFVIITVRMA